MKFQGDAHHQVFLGKTTAQQPRRNLLLVKLPKYTSKTKAGGRDQRMTKTLLASPHKVTASRVEAEEKNNWNAGYEQSDAHQQSEKLRREIF